MLVHHALLLLTIPYQDGLQLHPEKYYWYDKMLVYFFGLFKFGHEAVMLFFVLSGFVIHLKWADRKFKFSDFNLSHYLNNRIVRIYPTLITSLILSFVIDLLIRDDLFLTIQQYDLNLFLNNFLLVPDSSAWGSNWPIWSLKHEWLFYLIYPILLWCSSRHRSLGIVVPVLLFISYQFGYRIPYIGSAAYTLMVWCLGCVLAIFYRTRIDLRWLYPLLTFATIYPFFRSMENGHNWGSFVFGLVSTGFLALILDERVKMLNRFFIHFAWLGKFSYSVYLLHFPLLAAFGAIFIRGYVDGQKPYHLWYVLISIFVVLPLTYIIYYFTERPALNLRKV